MIELQKEIIFLISKFQLWNEWPSWPFCVPINRITIELQKELFFPNSNCGEKDLFGSFLRSDFLCTL